MAAIKLSEREQSVLDLLVGGNTPRDIAVVLVLSEHTVKTHLSRLYKRMGVKGQAEAVAVALATGLVPMDKVNVPKGMADATPGTRNLLRSNFDDTIIRRVLAADRGIPVAAVVRVVKVLRDLKLLKERA